MSQYHLMPYNDELYRFLLGVELGIALGSRCRSGQRFFFLALPQLFDDVSSQ